MDLDLKGKSIIVTGGGSNIGRGIVLAFAAEGANITIGDIDTEQAQKTADFAMQMGAASTQVVKTDVTQLDQVQVMFKTAVDKFGGVDVLVNNVGWDQLMFFYANDARVLAKGDSDQLCGGSELHQDST